MGKYFLLILFLFFLWLIFNYILLRVRNKKVAIIFETLERFLKKRYILLENMNLDIESKKYLDELKNLPQGKKFLNRKLALNYIITQNLARSSFEELLSDEYKIVNSEVETVGKEYNKCAAELKTAVEVFPTALLARLMNIKTVDFYRN